MTDACVIGVDLGGTKLLAGTVDAQLRVHHRAYRLSRPDAVVETIVEAVEEARQATRAEVRAVGVGVPCLVEPVSGVAMACNHFAIVDVPLRDLLAERLGLPVVVDNDATAALLAECRYGAARGARNVIVLTIGTGVGGGVLADGARPPRRDGRGRGARPHRHRRVRAAVPGQLPEPRLPGGLRVRARARARGPGARRGRAGLGARAGARGRARVTGPLVTELAHDGDPAARAAIATLGHHLGIGMTSLVNVFNPEVIVIGGGLVATGDLLLEPARAIVAERALIPARDQVRIVPARFGDESGMLGAAAMAFEAAGDLESIG